jgi:hypothetical protein
VTAPTGPAPLAEPFDPPMAIGGLRQQSSEDPVLFPIDQSPPLGEVRRCRVGVARQRSLGVIALRAGEAKVVEAVPPTQGEWDHMIDRPRPLARDEVTPAVPALVAIPCDQAFQCDGPPLTATKPTRHGPSLNPGCDSGRHHRPVRPRCGWSDDSWSDRSRVSAGPRSEFLASRGGPDASPSHRAQLVARR